MPAPESGSSSAPGSAIGPGDHARTGGWAGMAEAARRIRPPGGVRPVPGVIGIAAVILTYYVVPLHPERELVVRVIASLFGLGVVGAVIIHHVRRQDDPVGRLLLLFTVAVVVIALSFHTIVPTPGQFEGLETRTDALYFTVVTLATIGYGDIHPVGQAARVMVIVAMCFHVVFLTMLASVIGRRIRDRLDR